MEEQVPVCRISGSGPEKDRSSSIRNIPISGGGDTHVSIVSAPLIILRHLLRGTFSGDPRCASVVPLELTHQMAEAVAEESGRYFPPTHLINGFHESFEIQQGHPPARPHLPLRLEVRTAPPVWRPPKDGDMVLIQRYRAERDLIALGYTHKDFLSIVFPCTSVCISQDAATRMSWIPSKKHLDFVLAEESGDGVANTKDKEHKGPPSRSLLNIKKPLVWTHISEQVKNIVSITPTEMKGKNTTLLITKQQTSSLVAFCPRMGAPRLPVPEKLGVCLLNQGCRTGKLKDFSSICADPFAGQTVRDQKKTPCASFFPIGCASTQQVTLAIIPSYPMVLDPKYYGRLSGYGVNLFKLHAEALGFKPRQEH